MLTEINKMETILEGTNPIIWHVFLWAVCILLDVHNLYRQMATRPLFLYSTLKNCTLLCLHMYRGTGSTGCLQQRPLTVQINFWQGEKTKQVCKNSQLLTAKKSKTQLLYFFPSVRLNLLCWACLNSGQGTRQDTRQEEIGGVGANFSSV